ncbi:hypothetical protein ACFV4P_03075 [Kitasatospora sp. NPDC059795]|uniref:hypothetical protein n=1 Tax=Kitasatospora sp. NPDC059795 TaxID=3346949 RepID=UPI0036654A5F
MDAELSALAGAAATAIVQRLTTSAWEQIRSAVGTLWRRRHPEREATVLAELGEAREEVAEARHHNDERSERAVLDEWENRLRRLLAADPEAAAQLRELVEELTGTALTGGPSPSVVMNAHASGHGRIVQAARDIHITER